METLADALLEELARVREVLGHYKEIGPPGRFGAAMIEQELRVADSAVMSAYVFTEGCDCIGNVVNVSVERDGTVLIERDDRALEWTDNCTKPVIAERYRDRTEPPSVAESG